MGKRKKSEVFCKSNSEDDISSQHTLSTSARLKIRDKIIASGGLRKKIVFPQDENLMKLCHHSDTESSSIVTITESDTNQTSFSFPIDTSSPAPELSGRKTLDVVKQCATRAFNKMPSFCPYLGNDMSPRCRQKRKEMLPPCEEMLPPCDDILPQCDDMLPPCGEDSLIESSRIDPRVSTDIMSTEPNSLVEQETCLCDATDPRTLKKLKKAMRKRKLDRMRERREMRKTCTPSSDEDDANYNFIDENCCGSGKLTTDTVSVTRALDGKPARCYKRKTARKKPKKRKKARKKPKECKKKRRQRTKKYIELPRKSSYNLAQKLNRKQKRKEKKFFCLW